MTRSYYLAYGLIRGYTIPEAILFLTVRLCKPQKKKKSLAETPQKKHHRNIHISSASPPWIWKYLHLICLYANVAGDCRLEDVRAMCDESDVAVAPNDHGTEPPCFKGWSTFTSSQAELLAGNHRIRALESSFRQ